MYAKFYNLSENPFRLTPDPRFLYLPPSHREALAALIFGVLARKGFLVMSGEAGTGKTTLIHALLKTLNERQVASAFIFHPSLEPLDFLEYVLADLGIPAPSRQKGDMLRVLHAFLLKRQQAGGTTALIVDEAHKLSPTLLEEIRLFTNLETSSHKLLQVVLAGQSEMDELFRRDELRQLKQRISLRCRLLPLSREQMGEYLERRLSFCGRSAIELFPGETRELLYEFTGGIPRLINSVCDNALLLAFAEAAPHVTSAMIREAAGDLDLIRGPDIPGSHGPGSHAPGAARAVPSGPRPSPLPRTAVSGAPRAQAAIAAVASPKRAGVPVDGQIRAPSETLFRSALLSSNSGKKSGFAFLSGWWRKRRSPETEKDDQQA